jgi:hypothetical protein
MVNEKGFKNQGPGASVKSVGPQGVKGQGLDGAPCASQPYSGGKVPHKKPGKGLGELTAPQNGVMPKVGK